jgi:hypothetical protein
MHYTYLVLLIDISFIKLSYVIKVCMGKLF